MSAIQLSLPVRADLTPFDLALLGAIRASVDPQTRAVSSLFDLAVRRAGLDYSHAHYRLAWLELLGYVRVERQRPGLPLTIWLLV